MLCVLCISQWVPYVPPWIWQEVQDAQCQHDRPGHQLMQTQEHGLHGNFFHHNKSSTLLTTLPQVMWSTKSPLAVPSSLHTRTHSSMQTGTRYSALVVKPVLLSPPALPSKPLRVLPQTHWFYRATPKPAQASVQSAEKPQGDTGCDRPALLSSMSANTLRWTHANTPQAEINAGSGQKHITEEMKMVLIQLLFAFHLLLLFAFF